MVKVKNNGKQPYHFGRILAFGNGVVTAVKEDDIKIFCDNKAGAYVFDKDFEVVDENFNKKEIAEKTARQGKALIEAEKKLRPEIEKEIREKLTIEFKENIEILEKLIGEKEKEIISLQEENKKAEDKNFVFDPAIHSVEHRGAGKWYVMKNEEKIKGPLSEDDKNTFEGLLI